MCMGDGYLIRHKILLGGDVTNNRLANIYLFAAG